VDKYRQSDACVLSKHSAAVSLTLCILRIDAGTNKKSSNKVPVKNQVQQRDGSCANRMLCPSCSEKEERSHITLVPVGVALCCVLCVLCAVVSVRCVLCVRIHARIHNPPDLPPGRWLLASKKSRE
jgi:hypothetical protein